MIIGIPDESLEIKDTKESKKDDVPTNDKNLKEINPKGKTDMNQGIEIGKEAKEEQPLNVECINNGLEDERKIVTELHINGEDNVECLNNGLEDERKVVTELHIDGEDKTRKCIVKGIKGTLRKPMANFPNTYKFQVISATNIRTERK